MTGCQPFDQWCMQHNTPPLPASPAAVASFVADLAPLGIERLWGFVGEISRAHYLKGLADPTLGGKVSAALNAIAKIEAPRSWPKEHKFRFAQLPYDLQLYVAAREAQRDRAAVRVSQTEADLVRRGLIPSTKVKTNGNPKQSAAA